MSKMGELEVPYITRSREYMGGYRVPHSPKLSTQALNLTPHPKNPKNPKPTQESLE